MSKGRYEDPSDLVPRDTRESLIAKLYPGKFPGMSGRFAAILGYLFDVRYTDPYLADMNITSDGYIIVRHASDEDDEDDYMMHDEMFGSAGDLKRNTVNLLEVAMTFKSPLNAAELSLFRDLYNSKISSYTSESNIDADVARLIAKAEGEPIAGEDRDTRILESLRNLTEERGATPHEADTARKRIAEIEKKKKRKPRKKK